MSNHYRGPEGPARARDVIGFMEDHGVSPTPDNYFVFATYIAKDDPALVEDVDSLLDAGERLTSSTCSRLFSTYFPYVRTSDQTLEAGGMMEAQIASAVIALREADASQRLYGETLSGAAGQLLEVDVSDPGAMRAMMDDLVTSTERMRAHSSALERRLQDTTDEVSRLKDNLERIREEAMTDALTGVANRKRFDEELARAAHAANGGDKPLSLVMVDIDHFKKFNDTWGHQTGDQIIRFVANVLGRIAEENHVVARYGGEEFCVLMPGLTDTAASAFAERMRASVEAKKLLRRSTNENLGNVTISLGVAQFVPGEETWCFVERADQSLYDSKTGGRNRVTIAQIAKAA